LIIITHGTHRDFFDSSKFELTMMIGFVRVHCFTSCFDLPHLFDCQSILLVVLLQTAFRAMATSSRRQLANYSPLVLPAPLHASLFVRQLATAPNSGTTFPTVPVARSVFVDISNVEQKIIDVEKSIASVEVEIQDFLSRLKVAEGWDDSNPKKDK
jgi:hypothetical protein